MKFGLQISPYASGSTGNPWDSIKKAAQFADESIYDSIWIYDHFLYEGGFSAHPFSEPVMECFTTLSAIAAVTQRIHLGQLVTGVPYRNPGLMTKMATTLDIISQGRSILGLGASWHAREYKGYGWGEIEAVPVRMKRLEEALRIVLALWTECPASFDGKYYKLDQVVENPLPIQKPHPPILIGGSGEKVTLRLVAKYGQFCNVWGNPDTVRHLYGVLNNHCQQVLRPYDEITRSIQITVIIGRNQFDVEAKQERFKDYLPWNGEIALIGTPDTLIKMFKEYSQAGCQYVIFRMPDWSDLEPLQLFAERVIPYS
jgi:F420-dependent oxidoreductase-like protein